MMEWLIFALVLALAYANGTNDVSKAIATLVGSGVSNYRVAILWGTLWTMAGAGAAAFVAGAMVKTFSQGLIHAGSSVPPSVAIAVLAGAMVWVLLASHTGLPVSTTHALIGAIVGAGVAALEEGTVLWPAIIKKIALPLLFSPLLALAVSWILYPLVRMLAARWEGTCFCIMPASHTLITIDAQGNTRTLYQGVGFAQPIMADAGQCDRTGLPGFVVGLDTVHWLSSGLTSFARGTNDAPKILAMLLFGSATAVWPSSLYQITAFAGVALAMGLGSYAGGLRVTKVLAENVTKLDHAQGLSANLTTSSLVLLAGTLGLPVSTTHVSSSAIVGIGLRKGVQAVGWSTVRDMVLAWIVTLPATAILAFLSYWILSTAL